MHHLWVDCEDTKEITRVHTVRQWKNVEETARTDAGTLFIMRSTSCVGSMKAESQLKYKAHHALKEFVVNYLRKNIESPDREAHEDVRKASIQRGVDAKSTRKESFTLSSPLHRQKTRRGGIRHKGEQERRGGQIATKVSANAMILSLLKLLYQLVRGGFFKPSELEELRVPLLGMLDGRHDKVRRAQANSHLLRMPQAQAQAQAQA